MRLAKRAKSRYFFCLRPRLLPVRTPTCTTLSSIHHPSLISVDRAHRSSPPERHQRHAFESSRPPSSSVGVATVPDPPLPATAPGTLHRLHRDPATGHPYGPRATSSIDHHDRKTGLARKSLFHLGPLRRLRILDKMPASSIHKRNSATCLASSPFASRCAVLGIQHQGPSQSGDPSSPDACRPSRAP